MGNNNPTGGSPTVSVSGQNVYIAWRAIIANTSNSEIFFRASADGGANFGNPINISNSSRNSDPPKIVASEKIVYILWGDNTAGNYEIFFRASRDNGANFDPTINISNSPNFNQIANLATSENNVYVG